MENNYKFNANSKYFTIAAYTVLTCLVIALIVKIIFFWDSASDTLGNLFSAISPFFFGIIITFLITPLVNWMKKTFFGKWLKIKSPGLQSALAIACSYIIVILAVVSVIMFVIPNIYNALIHLAAKIGSLQDTLNNLAATLDKKYDLGLQDAIHQHLSKEALTSYVKDYASDISETLISTGVAFVSTVVNVIIALIVSCYLIIDQNIQARSFKRIAFAFLSEKKAESLSSSVKKSIHIFSNFFDGKMLDSLIMGVLCFFSMLIMGLFGLKGMYENALLVSLLIAITNMIPYFGPFIGMVPSALFLLVYSWQGALVFTIYTIVLMQVDANVISPKILGGSTGLRPLWVIFAIVIGGWAFGVIGMFLGVPIVATITGLLNDSVDKRLARKKIDMPPLD